MTPVLQALERCLRLMSRATPAPEDRDTWFSTISTATIIFANAASEDPPPRKSIWRTPALILISAAIGYLVATLG